jgi:hypothetical protein
LADQSDGGLKNLRSRHTTRRPAHDPEQTAFNHAVKQRQCNIPANVCGLPLYSAAQSGKIDCITATQTPATIQQLIE